MLNDKNYILRRNLLKELMIATKKREATKKRKLMKRKKNISTKIGKTKISNAW
jgi:hypothetical protein